MDIYAVTTQEVLDRIAKNCPSAMGAYFHCINRVNETGAVFFSKEMIVNEMKESFTILKIT